jgi:hypothetical protein
MIASTEDWVNGYDNRCMDQLMSRANLSDPEEFRTIAQYLEGKGWIAEADPDYGIFVLTLEGIDEAMNY